MSIARRIINGAVTVYEVADQPRTVRSYQETSNVVFLNVTRRESFTERARRLETAYLSGASYRQLPIEDQLRSPQYSRQTERRPIDNDDYRGSGPRLHSRRGRNDRYKDHGR